jgi:hypothetical protein
LLQAQWFQLPRKFRLAERRKKPVSVFDRHIWETGKAQAAVQGEYQPRMREASNKGLSAFLAQYLG